MSLDGRFVPFEIQARNEWTVRVWCLCGALRGKRHAEQEHDRDRVKDVSVHGESLTP